MVIAAIAAAIIPLEDPGTGSARVRADEGTSRSPDILGVRRVSLPKTPFSLIFLTFPSVPK